MCTKPELNKILTNFYNESKNLLGDKLREVILYGSYARGDYDNESDIDVVLLVDVPKDELYKLNRPITQLANKADWDYNAMLSPVIKNYQEFEQFKVVMPFYRNVDTEGVRLL